jgi:hypothetical protein
MLGSSEKSFAKGKRSRGGIGRKKILLADSPIVRDDVTLILSRCSVQTYRPEVPRRRHMISSGILPNRDLHGATKLSLNAMFQDDRAIGERDCRHDSRQTQSP